MLGTASRVARVENISHSPIGPLYLSLRCMAEEFNLPLKTAIRSIGEIMPGLTSSDHNRLENYNSQRIFQFPAKLPNAASTNCSFT